jgi:uncharacterized membrane protein
VSDAFEATLRPAQRHLARRLESFGDVVFGFTISQLVLQFPLPVVPTDLVAHSFRYVVYFITFALIALLWLGYHRVLSTAYAPTPADLSLTFVFLMFVGLTPYAMYAYLHFLTSVDGVRYGLGAYLICGIGTTGASTLIRARNYQRGASYLDPIERLKMYQRLLFTSLVVVILAFVLVVDVLANTIGTLAFILLPFANVLIRRIVRIAPVPGGPAVTAPAR